MWRDNVVVMNDEVKRVKGILGKCEFPEYEFDIVNDNGNLFLYATYRIGSEVLTTRKWVLPVAPTEDRIVKTAFRCILSSMEYRARSEFTYQWTNLFSPDVTVEDLLNMKADK